MISSNIKVGQEVLGVNKMSKYKAYGYYNSKKECLEYKLRDGNKIIAEGNLYEGTIHPIIERIIATNYPENNRYTYEHLDTKQEFEKA